MIECVRSPEWQACDQGCGVILGSRISDDATMVQGLVPDKALSRELTQARRTDLRTPGATPLATPGMTPSGSPRGSAPGTPFKN